MTRPYTHAAIVSALTELDRRDAARAIKARQRPNAYALAIMIGAAQDMAEEIERTGAAPHLVFADYFNPTRGNHAIARGFGWPLDVQRGQWVQS